MSLRDRKVIFSTTWEISTIPILYKSAPLPYRPVENYSGDGVGESASQTSMALDVVSYTASPSILALQMYGDFS